MAGICNSDFLLKLVPYGFDTLTLGGYNVDSLSIEAGSKILERGRKEFHYLEDEIYNVIESEVYKIKNSSSSCVSANLRSVYPDEIIEISRIKDLDIVEINCHCRQKELVQINCGQNMMFRSDFEDYIKEVTSKASSKVSVKIRANVPGIDTLEISKLINDCGADYLHIDAMKLGVFEADLDLISKISKETDIFIIGNNSIDSVQKAQDMLDAGAHGFSIGRAALGGKLSFDLSSL